MEQMLMKKPYSGLPPPSPSANSPLGMHKESQRISKVKPKIRIIHIFAPEIIKTDVANFRELVQRLTGKPSPSDRPHRKMKKQQSRRSPPSSSVPSPSPSSSSISEDHHHHHHHHHHHNHDHEAVLLQLADHDHDHHKKVEDMKNGGGVVLVKEEDREEEDNDDEEMMMIWNGANYLNNYNNNSSSSISSGSGSGSGLGFLGGFGEDLDGMIQELGEFPLFQPTHHHAFFEESHHHQLA